MLRSLISKRGPVRVQPFFGFRNANRLFLNARAIRSREPNFRKVSFWRDLATMLGQYASHEVADLDVTLDYTRDDGTLVSAKALSGPEGFLAFDVALDPPSPVPERTRWETATLRWQSPDGAREEREASAFILTPGEQTQTGVISDIDDTILETGITGDFRMIARNWKRVMATMPSERAEVPHAQDFYAAIGGNPAGSREPGEAIGALEPEARVRPVFYVSSSPWNLFSYLVTFQKNRNLPLGPIMLRDWGFNRKTLGKQGHGSHKEEAIARILKTFPHLKFALIGDDTQKDLTAFGKTVATFPGRIAAVFIRVVSDQPMSDEAMLAAHVIEQSGVPFWRGGDYRAAKAFLRGAGLELEGGVKPLVRTATGTDSAAGASPADNTVS